MINRLVIVGATGDLTARYLLPGLAALRAANRLPDGFQLVFADRKGWTDEEFARWAEERLAQHGPTIPADARTWVATTARYQQADATDPADIGALIGDNEPLILYLAVPPAVFPGAITALRGTGLPEGSLIVLEKPFGEDLESAQELNRLLAGVVPERAVFRVDHFLAMTTVQNLLGSRLSNRVLEPLWNSAHISEIEIVWDETLTLEGRAGYYDGVGALKDVVQNHLLQVMCLVAMEPPLSLGERDLRDRKLDVLRSVRPLTERDVRRHTRRARYLAGHIGDRQVPSYVDEDGVDPHGRTETLAEVELRLENWRWSDTTFRLRSGKALKADRKEVAVWFRPVPHLPFGQTAEPPPNVLRFGLDPESMSLSLTGVGSSGHTLAPITMTTQMQGPDLPVYGQLLLEILNGNAALSIRGDEAEEAWRVFAPIMSAWSDERVPLEEYPAGTLGPENWRQ